jgi:hypothetical protein
MEKSKKIFEDILISPNHNEQIVSIICSALTSCFPEEYKRINKILQDIINNNQKELKKECYKGLPENLPSLRALIWKMNFKYLPRNVSKWKYILKSLREEYKDLKNAVIVRQKEEIKIFEEIEIKNTEKKNRKNANHKNNNNVQNSINRINLEESKNSMDDTINKSLNLLAESTDKKLLETINKDINRTYSTLNFFSKPINNKVKLSPDEINDLYLLKKSCIYQDSTLVYTKGRKSNDLLHKEIHSDVLERILYIYAKTNKDVGYVQGMNAILAPIYYCYCLDNTCEEENIEADTFWSFSFLMDDIKKIFQKQNDSLKGGIIDKVLLLELMVSKIQKEIFNKLQKSNKTDCFYFAIKWINLFFSQQMIMPDVLRLWDIIFSEDNRYYFVYIFSLAILEYHKKEILKKDYYEIVEKLQKLNLENIEELIKISFNIRKNHSKEIKEILYYYNENEINNIDNKKKEKIKIDNNNIQSKNNVKIRNKDAKENINEVKVQKPLPNKK